MSQKSYIFPGNEIMTGSAAKKSTVLNQHINPIQLISQKRRNKKTRTRGESTKNDARGKNDALLNLKIVFIFKCRMRSGRVFHRPSACRRWSGRGSGRKTRRDATHAIGGRWCKRPGPARPRTARYLNSAIFQRDVAMSSVRWFRPIGRWNHAPLSGQCGARRNCFVLVVVCFCGRFCRSPSRCGLFVDFCSFC